ncbi:MAG: ribonucleotide-diphosphate reductase subunit beta, partial [Pseudomonadota bacterium]
MLTFEDESIQPEISLLNTMHSNMTDRDVAMQSHLLLQRVEDDHEDSDATTGTAEAIDGNANRRISVEDKQIINCKSDVNQLVPFKYKWAWDKYLGACANHWMPQEISMSRDISLW